MTWQGGGCLDLLTSSCHPGNPRNSGAHGEPAAQPESQIRLLTFREQEVSEAGGGEGLNNHSFSLDLIGRREG